LRTYAANHGIVPAHLGIRQQPVICPKCENYFLAEDLKRRFCSQRCKDEFFNVEKAKVGYFKANREKKSKERLNKARELLKKGRSEQFVMRELRLTRKALERAGLI
jgi:hypothetical protein